MPTNRILAPSLIALTLLATACDDKKQQGGGFPPMGPVPVAVVTVQEQDLPLWTELPGRTSAFRVAELRPQVSGIIQKRLFREGAEVKAGQQLYQIDPASYQAAVQSAQADLAKAQANLKSVQARAARYGELVKIDAVSHQDYDDAVAGLDQAKAQILSAQAALRTAQVNLDFTRVYAPITGRIGKSAVTEGALVTAGQAASLATITQLDPIYVDLSQSSADVLRLRQQSGGKSETAVQLFPDGADKPYDQTGSLQFAEVTVDPSTGSIQLRAQFPNPHQDLYPGLFVRARIEQGTRPHALLVPQQALVRTPDGASMVWVVDADNKVTPHPVTAEQAMGDKWLITQGLTNGDKVVVEGLQKIRPGAPVVPSPAVQP